MKATSPSKKGPTQRSPIRRGAIAFVSLVSIWLSVVVTHEIISTRFFPKVGSTQFTCRSGARALYESLQQVTAQPSTLPVPERVALTSFRKQLDPVWSQVRAIKRVCKTDKDVDGLKALRTVEVLRYAEERAIRLTAIDLTKWRARAPQLLEALGRKNDVIKKNASSPLTDSPAPSSPKEKN